MKKKAILSLMATAALLFTSCEELLGEWDYMSASMLVHITDDAGTNLLDTTKVGNLFEKGMGQMTLSSRDDGEPIRTMSEYLNSTLTRAYVGPWAGAVLTKDKVDGSAVLFIGEFNEQSDSKKREITLGFADGRCVTIEYYHRANLRHQLETQAKVSKKTDDELHRGLNVNIEFDTKYDCGYLYNENKQQ